MLDDDFKKERAKVVRDLAEQADPFTKARLLDLAERYDVDQPKARTAIPIDMQFQPRQRAGELPGDGKQASAGLSGIEKGRFRDPAGQ